MSKKKRQEKRESTWILIRWCRNFSEGWKWKRERERERERERRRKI